MTRRSPDAQLIAAIGATGGTSGGTANGVLSSILSTQSAASPDRAAITVKRADDTWGASSPYGSGQAFEILSPSTQDADDMTGDGIAGGGENPVLARFDPYGGLGLVNGLHIAPGLRNTHGGPTPIGLWVQLTGTDTAGIIVSLTNPAIVPSPAVPALSVRTYDGLARWWITSVGHQIMFADNGSDNAIGLYSGDAGVGGYRAILQTIAAATGGLAVKAAASQVGHLLAAVDSAGLTLATVTADGHLITYGDDGATNAAAVYAGDAGVTGYRAILQTIAAATGGLAVKGAASQTGNLIAALDSTGKTRMAVAPGGTVVTFADDGSTNAAAVYAGDAGGGGYRAILQTISAATGGLAVKGAASQSGHLIAGTNSAGTYLAAMTAGGHLVTFGTDGATNAAAIYAGNAGGSGYRAILQTVAASTGGLAVKAAASQSGLLIAALTNSGAASVAVNGSGHLITYGDDGVTNAASIASKNAGNSSFRAIFNTLAAGTGGVAVKAAAAQSGALVAVLDSGGNVLSEVNAGGTWVSNVATGGMVLRAPNGTYYRLTVSNTGVVAATAIGTSLPTT